MKINKKRLAIEMANKEMNGITLAHKAGVTPAALSAARGYKGNHRPETVGRIARALGVSVESIAVFDEEGAAV